MLEKRIGELTGDELASARIALGVRGRPYPMREVIFAEDKSGTRTMVQRIGVLEDNDNPLILYSDRPYAEVVGLAYRDMPTPAMLSLFFDAIYRRRPESKVRAQFLKGDPGAGKTFMSELIGRMRDPRGPIVVNCGDKNLSELLFETVLDFNSDRRFYNELDKQLAAGKISPVSRTILREFLGTAYSEDNGRASIHWAGIGNGLCEYAGVKLGKREALEHAMKGLERIREIEGLGHLGGNALGMATQEGPLIRAWKEGREIVLDEYNKSKEGTDGGLQGVLQFLAGLSDHEVVENTLKDKGDQSAQVFTFRRQDMRAGFFVTLTGNSEVDGATTRELSQSVHSRVPPQKIPNAAREDWQHRICQMLTGVPVSTIYRANQVQWDEDQEGFKKFLLHVRTVGLNQDQVKNIPDLHLRLLRRWPDVLEASKRLAKFYEGWSQLVDPDSGLLRSGALGKLMMEVDDTYKSEMSIDFRKVIRNNDDSMDIRPQVVSSHNSAGFKDMDFSSPPELPRPGFREDPVMRFGSRLCDLIMLSIYSTTKAVGKEALFQQLVTHAADCGIIDANLQEARQSQRRKVRDLLNENIYDDKNIDIQASTTRDMICAMIRDMVPGLSDKNDDILTTHMVRSVLENLDALAEPVSAPERDVSGDIDSNMLVAVNSNFDSVSAEPFRVVSTLDLTRCPSVDAGLLPNINELLKDDDLFATLAMPRIGDRNLAGLWNNAISRSGIAVQGEGEVTDKSIGIAEAYEIHRLAMTTVVVRTDTANGPEATPVHILWNRERDEFVMIGDHLNPSLTTIFNHRGITFISRHEPSAAAKLHKAMEKVTGKLDDKETQDLRNAFLLRNRMDDEVEEAKASLETLMLGRDVRPYLPHYILNRSLKLQPKAA